MLFKGFSSLGDSMILTFQHSETAANSHTNSLSSFENALWEIFLKLEHNIKLEMPK